MTKRTLSLRREALTELAAPELASVAGGAAPPTLNVRECLDGISGHTCIDCLTRYC